MLRAARLKKNSQNGMTAKAAVLQEGSCKKWVGSAIWASTAPAPSPSQTSAHPDDTALKRLAQTKWLPD